MATTVGPAVPLGYDSGSWDTSLPFEELALLEELGLGAMTAGDDAFYASFDGQAMPNPHYVDIRSSINESTMTEHSSFDLGDDFGASDVPHPIAEDAIGSHLPYRQLAARFANRVEEVAGGSSSQSPGTDPMILTPASTLLDFTASTSDSNYPDSQETDEDNTSQISTSHTDGEYVVVPRHNFGPTAVYTSGRQTFMSNHPPPPSSSGASGASDAQHASRASSVAPSAVNYSGTASQWGAFTTADAFMNQRHNQQDGGISYDLLSVSATYHFQEPSYVSTRQGYTGEAFLTNATSALANDGLDAGFNANLPYCSVDENQMTAQDAYRFGSFVQPHPQWYQQQQSHLNASVQQQQQPQHMQAQQPAMHTDSGNNVRTNIESPPSSLGLPQQASFHASPAIAEQQALMLGSSVEPGPTAARRRVPTLPSTRASREPQPYQAMPPNSATQQARQPSITSAKKQPSPVASSSKRPLAKANPAPALADDTARQSQGGKARKGGRPKNSHLPEQVRQQSHRMRKEGSCWCCALQRDKCDEGAPCSRCVTKMQKRQMIYIDSCDRSKLPAFVHDFLPPQASMTLMHQKQTIEDTVKDQVLDWDQQHPIDIYLTSGYGPPLRWKLYEFKPRTNDLLGQFQYLQDPRTGVSQRYHKYSPPFGLIKLDASDDSQFEKYLDDLLSEEYLWEFGWTCFEEESQIDPDMFQATLLNLMCKLYQETQDYDLKHLLKDIIRMMMITYIMGHTLTILEETLPSVLGSVRHSPAGPRQQHTSPRLANRQLKFYFAVFRTNIYEKILKWQQGTLRDSAPREQSWLASFCAMLGFAMMLEEVQRTLLIQADAKAAKGEMTFTQANNEAENACERIDDRFKLLVGLFQCKYRDKKWGQNGSFGPATPQFSDLASRDFLGDARQLLESKKDHLVQRDHVPFALQNQCLYTSRLVARFLLPFLGLPRT
ncbi:hypothetical protein LTR37_010368 [Vermiconidia calcicola]|uniref:Uncharacterized protein n=1 Tax=Vermiconidia calcicola TaxID=1690605 RepID=A0ACC3N5B2_9PEZI|nr:hypothetical protein LTR37_010368 [Vermiconidia calcicola]